MTILVYINQEPAGELTLSQEGLYTQLTAEVPGRGGLVRLWAHGGGESAYLGVMQPEQDGLVLRRRLSRRELAAFPQPIEFVSDRERDGEEESGKDLHNEVNINEEAGRDPEPAAQGEEAGESCRSTETDYSACPWPAEPPEEGLLWYSRGDGSLTAFDGVSSLLALPAELRIPGPQGAERVIEGKKYLVFRY